MSKLSSGRNNDQALHSNLRRIIAWLKIIVSMQRHPAGGLLPRHGTLERPGIAFHAGALERSI